MPAKRSALTPRRNAPLPEVLRAGELLKVLRAFNRGDFSVRLPTEGSDVPSGTADISFFCDDIHGTVTALKRRGVEFTQDVEDHGYGWVTYFRAPGDFRIQLYQAKYRK